MKEYCKLCRKYGTTLPNFPIRIGGIYGKVDNRLFVCESYLHIQDGKLVVCVSRNGGKFWQPEMIDSKNKIFKMVYNCIVAENDGKIPQVGTYRDRFTKMAGRPAEREVNYKYMRFKDTAYQLRKQNSDNADFGGGGDAVMRNDRIDHMKSKPESLQYSNEKIRRVTINDGEIIYDEITKNDKLVKINYKTR